MNCVAGADASVHRARSDRGSLMPMAVIFVIALMSATSAFVSASQAWGARRDSQAAASAAARAAAAPGPTEIQRGQVSLDSATAAARAREVLNASGHSGSISVNGNVVIVSATGAVDYAFFSPGFPKTMTASATARAEVGVGGGSP